MAQKKRQPMVVRESAPAWGVVVAERGRFVLPAELRERLSIRTGDHLLVTEEADGSIRLVRRGDLIRRLQGSWAAPGSGRRWSDELLAERRREAAREDSR